MHSSFGIVFDPVLPCDLVTPLRHLLNAHLWEAALAIWDLNLGDTGHPCGGWTGFLSHPGAYSGVPQCSWDPRTPTGRKHKAFFPPGPTLGMKQHLIPGGGGTHGPSGGREQRHPVGFAPGLPRVSAAPSGFPLPEQPRESMVVDCTPSSWRGFSRTSSQDVILRG